MSREGTSIEVLEVDYERVEVARRGRRFEVDADWSVGGIVTHQQHRHPRVNRYRALYRLEPFGDSEEAAALRIVATSLRSLERVRGGAAAGTPFEELPTSARGTLSLGDLLRAGALDDVAGEGVATETPDPPP